MSPVSSETAERLTRIYFEYHKAVVKIVEEERGHPPKQYKRMQLGRIKGLFQSIGLEGLTIIDQAMKILSGLIVCHGLPNTNHRTSFSFIEVFLDANGVQFPYYRGRRDWIRRYRLDGNRYIYDSKYILKLKAEQQEYRKRFQEGRRIMYLGGGGGGGRRVIRAEDLGLSRREYIKRHRSLTKNWLERMLLGQSERYLKTAEDSLSKAIALAER